MEYRLAIKLRSIRAGFRISAEYLQSVRVENYKMSKIFVLFFVVFAAERTMAGPALLVEPDAPAAIPPRSPPDCYTRKTSRGGCCVFPFTYRGETFYDCTTKNLGIEWCATTESYDKNPKKWGFCTGKAPKLVFDQILQSNKKSAGTVARYGKGIKLIEGDIVVTDEVRRRYGSSSRTKRAAKKGKRGLWLDSSGRPLIPYEIQPSNYHARGNIQRAMSHLQSKVPCLRFVPNSRARQRHYLSFHSGGGCWSMVGKTFRGRQLISIGRGCEGVGVIVHEIGHALGFWHEQSRPDRDNYVRINWQNIQSGAAYNFQKQTTASVDSLGVPYDLRSVMHYGSTAFLRPGARGYTIIGRNGETNLGQRYGLAASDALQLNKMYCGGTGPKPPRPPTPPPPQPGCRYTDDHRWCSYWKAQGYCTHSTHRDFMEKSCRKSCFCRENSCRDKNTADCPGWQRSGYCNHSTYGQYVRSYCRKSCNLCS